MGAQKIEGKINRFVDKTLDRWRDADSKREEGRKEYRENGKE